MVKISVEAGSPGCVGHATWFGNVSQGWSQAAWQCVLRTWLTLIGVGLMLSSKALLLWANLKYHKTTPPLSLMPSKAMGLDAFGLLEIFAPAHYVPLFDESNVDQQTFTGIIQGANFTAAVVKWLSHCRWPPDIQNDYKRSDDWASLG